MDVIYMICSAIFTSLRSSDKLQADKMRFIFVASVKLLCFYEQINSLSILVRTSPFLVDAPCLCFMRRATTIDIKIFRNISVSWVRSLVVDFMIIEVSVEAKLIRL